MWNVFSMYLTSCGSHIYRMTLAWYLIVASQCFGRFVFDIKEEGLIWSSQVPIELVSYALLIMFFSSLPRAVGEMDLLA